jgi:hypothetical protein
MTTSTLPRVAATLDGSGPFYAGRSVDGGIFWVSQPELPPTWTWAEDGEVETAHVLLDMVAVAQLLFASPLGPDDGPTDELLCATVAGQLAACRCVLGRCAALLVDEYDNHPVQAAPRMTVCLQWAAQIVRTETAGVENG